MGENDRDDGSVTISETPKALAEEFGGASDAPIGAPMGIATIALNMALKYHDINTVQDGALYQQYKLEGKNLSVLHLDHVFETAMRIEEHLIAANTRVSKLIVAQALAELPDEDPEQSAAGEGESGQSSKDIPNG